MWWILIGPFLLALIVTLFAPKIIQHRDQARALATARAAQGTATPTVTPRISN